MAHFKNRKLKTKSIYEHGGEYAVGRRKRRRPLDIKKPTHLVLKSSCAKELGVSFVKSRSLVDKIIRLQAERAKVRIYSLAVVGNHLHLAIYFKERVQYVNFIRAATGHLILALSKVINKPLKGLFDLLPYTRIVEWGRAYKKLINYIAINDLESRGIVSGDRKEWVLGALVLEDKSRTNMQLAFL